MSHKTGKKRKLTKYNICMRGKLKGKMKNKTKAQRGQTFKSAAHSCKGR